MNAESTEKPFSVFQFGWYSDKSFDHQESIPQKCSILIIRYKFKKIIVSFFVHFCRSKCKKIIPDPNKK